MKRIKNQVSFMLEVIALMMFLCACGYRSNKGPTDVELVYEYADIILEGIETSDYTATAELFSPYAKKKEPDLENDIIELMKYIDGEIVSYNENIICGSLGGETTPAGWVEKEVYGEIYDVVTSTGKKYTLRFEMYYVYKEEPDKVGIKAIRIISDDTMKENGYPEEKFIRYE